MFLFNGRKKNISYNVIISYTFADLGVIYTTEISLCSFKGSIWSFFLWYFYHSHILFKNNDFVLLFLFWPLDRSSKRSSLWRCLAPSLRPVKFSLLSSMFETLFMSIVNIQSFLKDWVAVFLGPFSLILMNLCELVSQSK